MLQFRASSVGKIMAYPEKDTLPKGANTFLEEMASQIILDWKPELDNYYLEKGRMVEDDSIALFNEVIGEFYSKNTDRKSNDLFTGECDIYDAEKSIIWDIKSSYSKKTHDLFLDISGNKDYFWQLVTYSILWETEHAGLAKILVDTPDGLIKTQDPLSWHQVSNIDPKYRVTTASMSVTQELKDQLTSRAKLAQNKLKEMLTEKGFEFK